MALTPSTMFLPLGAEAPDFRLKDTEGQPISLGDLGGAKAYLVMFICNHCPYVKHLREGIRDLAQEFQEQGVAVVAINSNDADAYPDDSPEKMREEKALVGYTFPYLYDETQEVAQAYHAACTPDFFVFDADRKLAYRGQFDASRPGNDVPVSGEDLRAALEAILQGKPAPEPQRPSIGCNIKWRPGQEPTYEVE